MEDSKVSIITLNNYVKPEVKEVQSKEWVLNGRDNDFFVYIIKRYNGSPTNQAIINGFSELIYGKGLNIGSEILNKKEVRKIVSDFKLFGSASFQVIYSKGSGALRKITGVYHLPRETVAPNKMNEEGEITKYWYCQDWKKTRKYEPKSFPAFGTSKEGIEIYVIEPYKAGKFYFSDPDYLAGLQYALLEEEISNYSISHIQNGLSAGFIINFNNGVPEKEEREEIKRDIKKKLTGSNAAGNVVVAFNANKEAATTIEAVPTNSNQHKQWEFWVVEARTQLMVSHRVTSPMLFGIKDSTGLGNNAEELETAMKLMYGTVISPMQEQILDAFQEVLKVNGIDQELEFKPLISFVKEDGEKVQEGENVEMSAHKIDDTPALNHLLDCGEVIGDDYELIDEREVTENFDFNLAREFSSSWKALSEQDTDLFKVRYKYAPNTTSENSRDFCKKLVQADKVYRKEDIVLAGDKVVNPGLGLKGADTYSIWLYKGGVNCSHFWQRQIYLRKDNTKISVNEARAMINAQPPSERQRLPVNDKEVAQPAGSNNNYWRVN